MIPEGPQGFAALLLILVEASAVIEPWDAHAMVRAVVQELWDSDRRPVLGARLKLEVLRRARASGRTFNERDHGFPTFAAFLEATPGITLHRQPGTDFVVVPGTSADGPLVAGAAPTRIRADFWRAFVGFPAPMETRGYVRATDTIVVRPDGGGLPDDAIPVPIVSREQQLEWRADFIRSLGSDSPLSELTGTLSLDGGFATFARALDEHPEARRAWNAYWFQHVAAEIRAWGQENSIPESVWLVAAGYAGPRGSDDVLRGQLLALLGQIPTEHLAEIEVRLGWLVGRRDPRG